MFSSSRSYLTTWIFVVSVLWIRAITCQNAELDMYLNITGVSYTGEHGAGMLSVAMSYDSVYMIGSVEWTTKVSVVDQPDCNPLTHIGDHYAYVFTYDGVGSCKGNFTELQHGRTRHFATFYFESFREVFPGVNAYQIQTEKLVDHFVINKPTAVPLSLGVVPLVDVTEVISGDVVPLLIGFDETELSVWTAILIHKCDVSNNEQFLNDVNQNKYSEVAFNNGCPQVLSGGDTVLSKQSRINQTYTRAKVGWTVEGFVYGDSQMWLKCLGTLCDIRGECAIPSCNGREVNLAAASLEHETIFTIENLQYPTTTSEQTRETTTTTLYQTTETMPTTMSPLTLSMLFYEPGSTLPTFSTVEGNNIQIRITKTNLNSQYRDMMLESCQIANNEKFNYSPSQQLYADTFMLENCPQMSFMEVLTPVFSNNRNTIYINVKKAFKYSTGTNVFFRCNIVACTEYTLEHCHPKNDCIVTRSHLDSRLLSSLSRPTYTTVTDRISVLQKPPASLHPQPNFLINSINYNTVNLMSITNNFQNWTKYH